jgi:hypothetical protein
MINKNENGHGLRSTSKQGWELHNIWFVGKLKRKCGGSDIDFHLHDGGNGRNRHLFIEGKPSTNALTTGQEISFNGLSRLPGCTSIIAVCPALQTPEARNPNWRAPMDSLVTYQIIDDYFSATNGWITCTLQEFNDRIVHWHDGNEFNDKKFSSGNISVTSMELAFAKAEAMNG